MIELLAGLCLLIFGAELMVRAAVRLAARLHVRPLIIGLTIVALGSSAPQMAVSLQATLAHNADIAERVENVRQLRARGEMTLPSNLALEKLTNPFLRTAETSVKEKIDERDGRINPTPSAVFAGLRAWKDRF